jgi:predicted ribosome quality control (RQC) complex YloA/Tae2 family protein
VDDVATFNVIYGKDDDENDRFCEGYLEEDDTWTALFSFSRD